MAVELASAPSQNRGLGMPSLGTGTRVVEVIQLEVLIPGSG